MSREKQPYLLSKNAWSCAEWLPYQVTDDTKYEFLLYVHTVFAHSSTMDNARIDDFVYCETQNGLTQQKTNEDNKIILVGLLVNEKTKNHNTMTPKK